MPNTPITARRRPDLQATETRRKHDSSVVIKDPVSLKYVQLRPDEYFVLSMLDGQTSLEQIRDAYQQRFSPTKVSLPELNQLLFRLHRNGLTIADAAGQGDQLNRRRRDEHRQRMRQHFSSLLFIRFPGVDPEPLLRYLHPLMRPLLGPLGMSAALALCMIAAILFAAQWETFRAELPHMQQWMRLDTIAVLMIAISFTKVMHELGHALLCKHFGGECHCIGPMLLVFTPALFCDTSDSWTLPNRFHRAAVGLAGIGTEILLAAMATLVWSLTVPGTTHNVAMNIMLVCSVSTLLFNANPLLRYDGYYVLSDLCNVPNLAQRSRELIAWYAKRWMLGMHEPLTYTIAGAARGWMLFYGVASLAYRWALTLVILWFVSRMLRPYRLESLGIIICTVAAAGMLGFASRGLWSLANNPARRRRIRMNRLLITVLATAAMIAAMSLPIPRRITAGGRITAETQTPVVTLTAGRLDKLAVARGAIVEEGEIIATLINPDIELQFTRAQGRYQAQRILVESIKRSRVQQPKAADELPAAEALLREFRDQLSKRRSQKESLVIRAPSGGRLTTGPRRNESPSDDSAPYQLVNWTGYSTDSENRGCYLDVGTELFSIASEGDWAAELILTQSKVQEIDIGASVLLTLDALPSHTIDGVVTSIDTDHWRPERNASRHDDPASIRRDEPRATSYVVRISLADTELPLTIGAAAQALIDAEPKSLIGRLLQTFDGLIRF
tara:strand:- start:18071 stop:20254 length:2184 start_codon:yes stop_codon:yes gene_type:complete